MSADVRFTPSIVAVVRELVATSVAKHMGVRLDRQLGGAAPLI